MPCLCYLAIPDAAHDSLHLVEALAIALCGNALPLHAVFLAGHHLEYFQPEGSPVHRAFRGGRHFGAVPYGYCTDDQGHLQIVPDEAEVVREIIEHVTEGSTLYAEAKRLNELGLPTPGWRYSKGKKRPGANL